MRINELVTAPNGERITDPEKAILIQLADEAACLSGVRQCRRVLAECERKGVILRLPTEREREGPR